MKFLKKLFKDPAVTPIYFFIGIIIFAVLHNLFYALTGIEEAVFFILTLLCMLGFIISIFYLLVIVIIRRARGKKKLGLKVSKIALGFYLGILIMVIGYVLGMILEYSLPGNWLMLTGLIIVVVFIILFVLKRILKRRKK